MGLLKEKYGDKKLFITSSDDTGCGGFRTFFPYKFLQPSFNWINHSYGFPNGHPYLQEADIIWVQRASHETFPDLFQGLRSQGKKIIYDLDDTLWDIPASNLSHRFYGKKELRKVEAVMKSCDCLTTSTVPLQKFLQSKVDVPVFLMPNHVWHQEHPIKIPNEKLKIGWAGSYTHAGDFDHYLVDVLRNLPKDKVDFYTFGYNPQFFKSFSNFTNWVKFEEYHDTFMKMNWDIGIIVAENNMFNRCKSNIKYFEYSQARCASIACSTFPYVHTIEHGVDGFLIENKKRDWKEYIYHLIEDEKFRLEMADKAYEKVKHNYTWEYQRETIEQHYVDILDFMYEGKLNDTY